ncbi:hypothetical protein O3597_12265 [Verrucosispora sp. WMMA2044]|uniref:hypothetical protein n=1 Tax=Verrucosispora sp. WMMA2044 TaxID=3016419 RepID=UPI00248CF0B3|nr:hypothetical protein [Verrucosispora sp. WMMA2044]WBB51189.1 hypothetical protein O3597_12265 [Verrucosispora sp. WMMA2044]
MTDKRDLIHTLEKLRPGTTVTDQWPTTAREAALDRLLNALPPPVRRTRDRRMLLTAALTVGFVASGAGVAAAGGLLPESFTGPLSFWSTETKDTVNAQQARRVAQMPGPDGLVLSVWSATAPDGTTCIAPLFEPPGDLDRPAPVNFTLAGGQCARPEDSEPFASTSASTDENDRHTMWANAGNAARAELLLSDGTVRPAILTEGLFVFWYVANRTIDPPTLVGYDATGTVIAERSLPDLTGLEPRVVR